MKAVGFLEFRINELRNVANSETVSSGLMERNITKFYSQPFRPGIELTFKKEIEDKYFK